MGIDYVKSQAQRCATLYKIKKGKKGKWNNVYHSLPQIQISYFLSYTLSYKGE